MSTGSRIAATSDANYDAASAAITASGMAAASEAQLMEIQLPPYVGMQLADVTLVQSGADLASALAALLAADVIGFDTESKPTFVKGEVSSGPHLIQLATDDTAYLFQIGSKLAQQELSAALKTILESNTVMKVGFGLADDLKRLAIKLDIKATKVLDLSLALSKGQRNALGAKTAVARFFGLRLQKSKKISTTNWANVRLTERQILYAADDAHVALRVYRRWLADAAVMIPAGADPARAATSAY